MVFAVINGLIVHKESILTNGQTLLLKLVPRDPRSLMQGDYMALRYEIADEVEKISFDGKSTDGFLVVKRDENNVGHFTRFDNASALFEGEIRLRYRHRGSFRLGAESFFFQEGHAKFYEKAVYGELKVSPKGEIILLGLRDKDFKVLKPRR
jgi:uncharacterized membrane-anchored protein